MELRKETGSSRAYRTSEDAGNSYDPYATALRMQNSLRSDYDWSKVYYAYWIDSIAPQINATYPTLEIVRYDTLWIVPPDIFTLVPVAAYPEGAEDAWYAEMGQPCQLAQPGGAVDQQRLRQPQRCGHRPQGFLAPHTAEFNTLFNDLVGKKNNETEGGTRFYDRSSLVHVHGEKIFKPWWADEIDLVPTCVVTPQIQMGRSFRTRTAA